MKQETKNPNKTVRLFFRRANPTGNISIENSFSEMTAHYPEDSPVQLSIFRSSYFSHGLLPRIKAILEVRRNRADVNHITGDTNFFALGLPRRQTLLTIHDCGLLEGKNWFSRAFLWLFWLKLPVLKSQIVTVVSEATKRDVMRLTGCAAEKIVVVPTVIKSEFEFSPKNFNKDYPTFLHIGESANKNLERHAAALAGLPCHLHIIGKISEQQVTVLKDLNIDYTASVNLTDKEVFKAYQEADALLFCSTLEGFGMPIVEAQTVGRAVITSKISSMPEVAGTGAAFVDPLSIKDIRAAIHQVWHDDNYRNSLIQNGLSNVKRFNSKIVAQQYADLYASLL